MIECTTEQLLFLSIGALGLGMYMLLKGGNWTIDASVFLARKIGVSPLIIGFTIVAFGTSLPELIVSVNANLTGSPGIAIGNVIGSNIANILFVIGATAIFATLTVLPKDLVRDIGAMLMTTILLMALMLYGGISQMAGMIMVFILLAYVFWQYNMAKSGKISVEDVEEPEFKLTGHAIIFLILGLVFIALGAEFLVRGAKVSASIIGVPEDVIGLSVIALGTSLPELSTCIIAAMKRHTDIVVGNILGSNVFNILMILGITAGFKPIENGAIAKQVVTLDIWVMFGVSLLFALILLIYKKVNKPIGIIFLLGYVLYIGLIYALYLARDVIPT